MATISFKGMPPAQHALGYRISLLLRTRDELDKWVGRKNSLYNVLVECWAMQARLLMEMFGVKRIKRRGARDLKAKDISPSWKAPDGLRLWLDRCDRAAAHMTVRKKPDWNVDGLTKRLLSHATALLQADDAKRVSRKLRAWLERESGRLGSS